MPSLNLGITTGSSTKFFRMERVPLVHGFRGKRCLVPVPVGRAGGVPRLIRGPCCG